MPLPKIDPDLIEYTYLGILTAENAEGRREYQELNVFSLRSSAFSAVKNLRKLLCASAE